MSRRLDRVDAPSASLNIVGTVLVATDADSVFHELDASLGGDHQMIRVNRGADARSAARENEPDLVILDLQIGNMGGIATCIDLRLEQESERLEDSAIMILLDRRDDMFIAGEADADGWLVKPLNSIRIRKCANALLAGGDYFESLPTEPDTEPAEPSALNAD
jgi:DNA-binding response OmpR family regulator